MKKILFFLIISIISNSLTAQNQELNLFKNILLKGDSITKVEMDTIQLFKVANKLDKKHPSQYFDEMANYLNEEKFNEAAFLFYLGRMRYRYYNSANPKYQASNDGALLASLSMVLGEPINLYCRTNANNFIRILSVTKEYFKNNDYKFYSKKKNEIKYDEQINSVNKLIQTIESEKLTLEEEWKKELEKYMELYQGK